MQFVIINLLIGRSKVIVLKGMLLLRDKNLWFIFACDETETVVQFIST